MNSKTDKDKAKQLQDKCQSVLNALLRDEDNKYCVDCDSKGPRWASWNLGVFLCIRCAGIHRNLGVHISKVKSVNLDAWTPEQVVSLQQMGNSRARAVYEANMPDNFRRPQNDSALEAFVRAKYEHKKYIAREWVPPALPEVNWEREIDEEIDRQKRKKKTVVEKKSLGAVEVPQLPKPKNASPKPGRTQTPSIAPTPPVTPAVSTATDSKSSTDLLGLQNGDDSFSNFLSAPIATSTTNGTQAEKKPDEKETDTAKSEEESFFNQTAPTEKERIKMTKDSILALYGTAPPVNTFNPLASQGQFNAYQQPAQNFGQFPAQQPFQNGIPPQNQYPNQFPQQNQFNQFPSMMAAQPQPQPQQYQFPAMGGAFGTQMLPNGPPMQRFPNQFQPNQFQSQSNFLQQQQQPNPFFGQPASNPSIQQQFGNLSLNGAVATNGTPSALPTTANIWQ